MAFFKMVRQSLAILDILENQGSASQIGGHPALSDVTPCLLSDFFENSGGTPHPPISYRIAPSDFESQILHPPPPPFVYIWYFSYLYNCIKHNMNTYSYSNKIFTCV